MRLSRSFAKTAKNAPSGLDSTDAILVRAGYMCSAGAHGRVALPLGARLLARLRAKVLHELDALSAIPLARAAVVSAEIHRGHPFGEPPQRFTDERRASHVLSPSHVTVASELARHELRGFRDLPRLFVSAGASLTRDGGLHERDVVEACGFYGDEASARHALRSIGDAVVRVLASLHVPSRTHTGPGGAFVVHVASPLGDPLLVCEACGNASTVTRAYATSREPSAGPGAPATKVHTPGAKSIADVATFLSVESQRLLKSLLYRANGATVMVVVRGDHDVNERRLAELLGASEVALADAEEVRRATGAPVGFAGPVGYRGRVLVDTAAARVADAVVGANEADHHVRDVTYGRDFTGEIVDVRTAAAGAPCPACAAGVLAEARGYELARGVAVDPRVTEGWGVVHIDAGQKKVPTHVSDVTVDVGATLRAIVEATSTAAGLAWPSTLAPFDVHLVGLGAEAEVVSAADALYTDLVARGIDVLFDDRDEKPGSKLKDAELQGLPLRIALGKRSLATASAEVWERATGETTLVPLVDVAAWLASRSP